MANSKISKAKALKIIQNVLLIIVGILIACSVISQDIIKYLVGLALVVYGVFFLFRSVYDTKSFVMPFGVAGGILLGVGCGLIIKEGGCLDGTEIIAILVNRKKSLSVGQVVFCFNIAIYGAAIFVFGAERALYSLLTYFISYKVIDMVSDGLNSAKAAFIITDDGKEIASEILKRLGRSVTVLSGEGIISHGDKRVLYTVITRFEVPILKDILNYTDDSSFVTVFDVSEIIGNHIKKTPNYVGDMLEDRR